MKDFILIPLLVIGFMCLGGGTAHAATVSLELSPTQQVANEVDLTPAVIRFKRAAGDAVTSALIVNFSIGGTAIRATDAAAPVAGDDYTLGFGTSGNLQNGTQITIPIGQQSVALYINPLHDTAAEGQQTVIVQILAGSGYTPGLPNSLQAPIADDDVDVSLTSPLPLAYEDYTTGPGNVIDPDSNRRGAFRATLSPARTFSTYVVTELSAATGVGAAQVGTDYSVVYKIGGNGLGSGIGYVVLPRYTLSGVNMITLTDGTGGIPTGATIAFAGSPGTYTTSTGVVGSSGTVTLSPALTANILNGTAVTVTPNLPTGFRVNNSPGPYAVGTTNIAITGGTTNIPAGARITFADHLTTYTTTGLAGTSGSISISPALTDTVAHNEALSVSWPAISGYVTTGGNSEPVDTKSFVVSGGSGGFSIGDVFRIGGASSPQYVVTSYNSLSGVLGFTVFTGTGGLTGGIPSAITGATAITTHFTPAFSGTGGREIQLLVPGTSTKIEYGIVPTSDTTPEGAETLTMRLLTSNDFETVAPTASQMTITDDDVVVSLDPTVSVNATEGGVNGSFTVRLSSAFPGDIGIVYQVGGTATPSDDDDDNDYVALTGVLTIPAGSLSGIISVVPKDDGVVEDVAETVSVTLQPTNDYRVITTVGANANASAQITISDKMGTVVIAPVSPGTGREHPTAVTTAQFRVALLDDDGDEISATDDLTVAYTISGSATAGGDYQTLTGSVVIPDGQTFALITVTPIDDTIPEANDTVILTLAPAQGYLIGDANGATVTIVDDEPIVSVTKTTDATENGTVGVFTVSYLAPSLNRDIVVDLTYSGVATAGDYTLATAHGTPAQVVIPANSTSTTVTVTPIQDTAPETGETVIATITNKPAVYTRGTSTATVTIADDEPVVGVVKTTDAGENGDVGVFTVGYLPPALDRDITVELTYSGTAVTGDYVLATATGTPTQVVIPANSFSTTVTVTPNQDTTPEGDETVIATITDKPAVYTRGSGVTTATVTIEDDEPVLHIESIRDNTTEGNNEDTFRVYYEGDPLGRAIVVSLSYPTTTATATTADFTTAPPTSVTIPADDNEIIFKLAVKNDGVVEGVETVECSITAKPAVYSIATASATCEINDLLPILNIGDEDGYDLGGKAITEGGTLNVIIYASFKPVVPFTVTYTVIDTATPGDSAGGGRDYKTLSGTVQISELETVIPVETFIDSTFDPFEEVVITLTEADPPTYRNLSGGPLSFVVQILDAKLGVNEVTAEEVDDDYTVGDTFTIHVVFTAPVVVTGSPTLKLETGASDGIATFVGLDNNDYDAIFTYTVRGTDHSPNLDYASTTALSLNGGTITSKAGGTVMELILPAPGAVGSISNGHNRPIDGGIPDGKPSPGAVTGGSGGGCGLGSGFAALLGLFMLTGIALSVRRNRP